MADWFSKWFSTGAVACSVNNNIRKVPKDDEYYNNIKSTVIDGHLNLISSSHNDRDANHAVDYDDGVGKEYIFKHETTGKAQQDEKEKVEEIESLNDDDDDDDNNNNTILQETNFLEDDTNNGNEREGILLIQRTSKSDLEKAANFHINEMETQLNEASQETNNLQADTMEEKTHSTSLNNNDVVDESQTNNNIDNAILSVEKNEELSERRTEQVTHNISLDDNESNRGIVTDNTTNCDNNAVAIELPVPIRITRLKSFLSLSLMCLCIAIFYAYICLGENQREFYFCLFGSFIMGFIAILLTITKKCERSTEPQISHQIREIEPNSNGWVMFD